MSYCPRPTINLFSFATKDLTAPETRYRFDVTTCRDPIGQAHLKGTCANGTDDKILEWIAKDPKVGAIRDTVTFLIGLHTLPPQSEGSLSVGFHDFHGIWISPAIAILVARDIMAGKLANVNIHHERIKVTPVAPTKGWGGIHLLKAAGKGEETPCLTP